MSYIVLIGRIIFSVIFIMSGLNHLSGNGIELAAQSGVPLASVAVPLSGLISLLGGIGIAIGYKAKISAWLIVLFLLPVTITMHNFWSVADQHAALIQQIMFMKNFTIIGAAFLIAYFGSGPFSLDAKLKN
ncbi:MAG: DoxX family protein [Ignavibacteriales bacterium]|nr:DoxX family protein [Ignavibacteriales bacterium]